MQKTSVVIGIIAGAFSVSANAQVPTTGSINSRIGKLEIVNGYPTDETVARLYDALDFQRAVQR